VISKFTGVQVSALLWIFDVAILFSQIFFTNMDCTLYGFIMVCVYSLTLDKVMILGKKRMEIKIISEKHEEIKEAILSRIDRGLTILHGKTGYLGHETEVILTVISSRELAKTENLIRSIDPYAFVIVDKVSDVSGRGFSFGRYSSPKMR
ncbi:MAG: YitT family protein, partial [Clostridia bacterium]|nr:YitT family protein [Clostridia bacterium]